MNLFIELYNKSNTIKIIYLNEWKDLIVIREMEFNLMLIFIQLLNLKIDRRYKKYSNPNHHPYLKILNSDLNLNPNKKVILVV